MKKINIAIDGYSSCGKSTLAKMLAKSLTYIYIDTGAMYRAVALFALNNGMFEDDKLNEKELIGSLSKIEIGFRLNSETSVRETLLNGQNIENEIRDMRVSSKVSYVAEIPEVRKKLVLLQQKMGEHKGVVMDGRDIGTVVFPQAELKIFMTASEEIRTERRYAELISQGKNVAKEEVRNNLNQRDYIDTHRTADPLRQAEDALVLDNTNLNMDEQFKLALAWVNERLQAL
jgi:CMP/dCMP kinase